MKLNLIRNHLLNEPEGDQLILLGDKKKEPPLLKLQLLSLLQGWQQVCRRKEGRLTSNTLGVPSYFKQYSSTVIYLNVPSKISFGFFVRKKTDLDYGSLKTRFVPRSSYAYLSPRVPSTEERLFDYMLDTKVCITGFLNDSG